MAWRISSTSGRRALDDTRFTWEVETALPDRRNALNFELVTVRDGVASIAGRYRFPDSDVWQDVTLIFNDDGVADRIIGADAGGSGLASIGLAEGGEFQTYRAMVTPDGRVMREPGNSYTWRPGALRYDQAAAPTGTYQLGFLVTAIGGTTGFESVTVAVNNDNLDPTLRGYVDPDWGFNFHYPAVWFDVTYFPDDDWLQTSNAERTEFIFVYPVYAAAGQSPEAIAREALGRFQATPEGLAPISVAGQEGLEFTFSYLSDGQPFVGRGFAVYNAALELGLVFAAEVSDPARLDPIYATLRDSLTFFDILSYLEADAGFWSPNNEIEGVSFPVPTGWNIVQGDPWLFYTPETPDDSGYFITGAAVAQQPGTDAKVVLSSLLAQAAEIRMDYRVTGSEVYHSVNHTWETVLFEYTAPTGQAVAGRMHVTLVDGTAWALWFEAPADPAEALMRGPFDVMLDGFMVEGAGQ
ncbi:MAG: hypothetical protein HC915_13160 [Anaerolineae bacterium]|nr:hypothetical protein [Anaerolineae bacterium]